MSESEAKKEQHEETDRIIQYKKDKFVDCITKGLDQHVGVNFRKEILNGTNEILQETDELVLAQLTGKIMDRLDKLIVDPLTRKNLLLGCTCPFPQDRIDFLRSKYHEFDKDIAKLLHFMIHDDPRYYEKPVLEGNTIKMRKNPRNPEAYAIAETLLEKRKAYCFCPLVWATEDSISETYCYCSSGWYKTLWEGILETSVDIEVISSVIQGDDYCDFLIHLPEK